MEQARAELGTGVTSCGEIAAVQTASAQLQAGHVAIELVDDTDEAEQEHAVDDRESDEDTHEVQNERLEEH